jgi:hypothetical protein
MADPGLEATPGQLCDALDASRQLSGVYRRLLKMTLDELQLLETHIEKLEREAMGLMQAHQEVIRRVAEVPGFGPDSAMQMIAEEVRGQPLSPPPNNCLRGWGCVRVMKKAPGSRKARSRRKAIATCGGY